MKKTNRFLSLILALCLIIGLLPMGVFAATSTGTTTGEPFPQGTGGSNSFRIPALVTLSDGTLVAAADARWNTTYDGGGLDTIVSVSKDNGATWSYSFANYLGDNGDTYSGSGSTAFIDPALAVTSDDTIYMLVDLYPYGVALNGSGNTAPVTTKGFNDAGKLLLSNNNHNTYSYYLDGDTIYSSSGTAVSGYTVDGYFNVYQNGTYVSNLFFSDSPYKVVRTGFLYLTKSTDKGATWSEPTLLNLKTSSEQVCLVGPGRGLVTSSGMIVFPVYSYNGSQSSQSMGFIYSNDNGATWSRSVSLNNSSWSSESAVVELSSGALRFFYRNGTTNLCYVDYTNGTWSSSNIMTSVDTNSNCQISAITYSKTIDGNQVVLVSCPTGPSSAGSDQSGASYRLNGKIFAFSVDANGNMTQLGSIAVTSNDNQFMYSCLTELNDGTVGILYEDCESAWGTGSSCYYTMSYAEYDLESKLGVTFDEVTTEPEEPTPTETDVTVTGDGLSIKSAVEVTTVAGLTNFVAYDVTLTKNGADYTDSAVITINLNGKFGENETLWGFVVNSDGSITYVKNAVRDTENDTLTFTAPHFSTVGATPAVAAEGDTTLTDSVTSNGGTGTSYVLDTDGLDVGSQYLIVYNGNALTNTKGSLAVTVNGNYATPSGDASAALWTYTSWTSYTSTRYGLMNGSNYLYPSRSGSNWSGYTYSLNVGATQTRLTIGNNGDGTYTIANSSSNSYVAYASNAWGAQNSSQNLYFYKYTEGTESYTVDAALQESRIDSLTVANDNYTDDSWNAYKSALDAANAKLAEVEAATYSSETAASTALNELITAVNALETAKNALVKAVSITINYQVNGTTIATGKLNIASNATTATLPSTVVGTDGNTYKVTDTALTVTPGTTTYNVAVTLVEGTEISIKENETAEIEVTLSDGQYVEWSSADSSYVGVAGQYDATNKAYTDTAVIVGHNVTTDPVLVTGTVYNEDGSVAGTYKWLVTVTEGDADTNTSSKHIYVNVVTIEHCTVYYSVNAGELVKINGTGVLVDADVDGHYNLMFFAAPEEGYALSYMAVSGSGNQYYTLSNGNPDGTGSNAWPFDSATATTIPTSSSDSAWVDGHGFRWALLEGNFGIDQMKLMFSNALALGCTGATTFTKNGNDGFYTEVGFAAQKLPTMDKTIVSITHADGTVEEYKEGMELGIGDTINYQITITIPAELQGSILNTNGSYTVTSPITSTNKPSYTTGSFGTVSLTNGVLTDVLTGSVFYTSYNATTGAMSGAFNGTLTDADTSTDEQKLVYYTNITLGASNFLSLVKDGKISNEAGLTFDYVSNYAKGTLSEKSVAVAEILVEVPEYVIDFGLPLLIDLTSDPLVQGDKIKEATAMYGTVYISGDSTIVYIPSKILQGPDFITLTFYDSNGQTITAGTAIIGYGVRIHPATTIYYEEGFLFPNGAGNWTGNTSVNIYGDVTDKTTIPTQEPERINEEDSTGKVVSDKKYNYGYDPFYSGGIGASNGTQATATTLGATTTFTFTGTGFDLYANCTASTGRVMVWVKDANGASVKLFVVDTHVQAGDTGATSGQSGNFYNLPIVSLQGLTHGTYSVTINKVANGGDAADSPVYIDGVRIYGTIKDSTIFTEDLEDNPEFHELRDHVLHAIDVSKTATDNDGNTYQIADQIYANISSNGEAPVAVITDKNIENVYVEGATAQDLLNNGPKNELYLYANQTLTFKVTTKRMMQIGLKAPVGATSYTIKYVVGDATTTVADGVALNTSVDMFYSLNSAPTTSEVTYTVTITNNGTNILAITDLKICDDPSFAFQALTVADVEIALGNLPPEAETPEEELPEEEIPEETVPEETKPGHGRPGKDENNRPGRPGKPGHGNGNWKDAAKVIFDKITDLLKGFFGR